VVETKTELEMKNIGLKLKINANVATVGNVKKSIHIIAGLSSTESYSYMFPYC